MATLKTDTPVEVLREAYRDVAVFRQFNGKIYMYAKPDRLSIKWSDRQRAYRQRFKRANQMAKAILSEPGKREEYLAKCGPGEKPYWILLREIMNEQ